ncbi:Glutamate receptor ionotropic, kainate 3 [Halotydeus destructor]|nr:Glutamate receptor ionotropic, kainate 3 [Halotydeus destructor]
MLHLVLLTIAFTVCPVAVLANEVNRVTLAVTIDKGQSAQQVALIKNAVNKALMATKTVEGVVIDASPRVVFTTDKMAPQELCESVMGQELPPTLLIDFGTVDENGAGTSEMVKSLGRKMGLPTVTASSYIGVSGMQAWTNLTHRESEYLIQVAPPGDLLLALFRDIVKADQITKAAILCDEQNMISEKNDILLASNLDYHVIQISHNDSAEQLAELKAKGITDYFVFGTMVTINKLLEAAHKQKMFRDMYKWNLLTKSRAKVMCQACHLANVHVYQPMKATFFEYDHKAQLSSLTLETKVDAFFYYDLTRTLVDQVAQLMSLDHWPTLSYPKCSDESMTVDQSVQRIKLKLAQELSWEGHAGQFGRFVFDNYVHGYVYQDTIVKMTHMELWSNQADTVNKLGEWAFGDPEGRFIYAEEQHSDHRLSINIDGQPRETELKQKTLRIVMILQPPFIMKRKNDSIEWRKYNGTQYYGYCIDLLKLVADKMNNGSDPWDWNYDLYEVPDGRFGEKRADGSWTGVIGELAERKADIGLGPVAVMAEREVAVDFTVPYYDLVGISILMKKASVPSHLFKFLTVLDNNVWFSILGGYLIVSTLIYIYDRYSPYSYTNAKEGWETDPRREFSFKECLWFGMTSLTPQGGGEAPLNLSGRVAAGVWWLFAFIVIAAYTANLAAFLTVSRLETTIENLDHLADQFRIRYAPQEKTSAETYFIRMAHIEKKFYEIWVDMTKDPVEKKKYAVWDYPISNKYTKILEQMHQAGMPKHYAQGVSQVRASKSAQEGFAFITEATQAKYAVVTHCDLTTVGNEFSRKPIALVVQQNSTLKDRLSSAILKLLNERQLESLKEEWWDNYRRVCEDTKKSSDGISIHNIGGVFIVIFIGVILACITLVFEYIFLRRKAALEASQTAVTQYNNIFKQSGILDQNGPNVNSAAQNGGKLFGQM